MDVHSKSGLAEWISLQFSQPIVKAVLETHRCHVKTIDVDGVGGVVCLGVNSGSWDPAITCSESFAEDFRRAIRAGWDILRRARDECVAQGWIDGLPVWPADRRAKPGDMEDEASESVWTLLSHRDEILRFLVDDQEDRDQGQAETSQKRRPWWKDTEPLAGSLFKHGPLEGCLDQLAAWCDQDERTLKNHNGAGHWIYRESSRSFRMWFKSQVSYSRANARRLREEQSGGTKDPESARKRT